MQLGSVLIIACNQQSHTEWPAHDALFPVCTFSEPQGEVAYCLRTALHAERLSEVEGVVLALHTCMFDHGPRIGLQAGHGTADVVVDLDDLLNGRGFKEGRRNALLDTENHTFGRSNLIGVFCLSGNRSLCSIYTNIIARCWSFVV